MGGLTWYKILPQTLLIYFYFLFLTYMRLKWFTKSQPKRIIDKPPRGGSMVWDKFQAYISHNTSWFWFLAVVNHTMVPKKRLKCLYKSSRLAKKWITVAKIFIRKEKNYREQNVKYEQTRKAVNKNGWWVGDLVDEVPHHNHNHHDKFLLILISEILQLEDSY